LMFVANFLQFFSHIPIKNAGLEGKKFFIRAFCRLFAIPKIF
jgi:hypothetical protein